MDGYASVQVTPQDPSDLPFIILTSRTRPALPCSLLAIPCLSIHPLSTLLSSPISQAPTSFPLTHHHGNVENVHLLLYNLRGLLECGGGGPGQLPGAAHGDMEVQGAVLQPLLPPVHQRDVCCRARHLCKTRPKVLGELHAWPHVSGREEATPTQELRRYLLCARIHVLTSNL